MKPLIWSYDEQGASADMDGLDNPTFFVNKALDNNGYIAIERFPSGLRVVQPVPSLGAGVAWCEEAALLEQSKGDSDERTRRTAKKTASCTQQTK